MSYRNLAIDAISKCMGYDPYLPQTEAMVQAWAEALETAKIDTRVDVLAAVAKMYLDHGDPGWRPTPKVLIATARECRRTRREADAAEAERVSALEGPERITLKEWRERHPDIPLPTTFGKEVPSDG